VLRALRYFEGFRGGDSRAWLLAIIRNTCYSWHRAQRNDRSTVRFGGDDAADTIADPRGADDLANESSERDLIRAALDALPPELKEVIVLRELNDLSYREISEVVGAPMGTVMSRLSRARDRLADALGRDSRRAG
jgi:RNA polymerase sigma-70 factor (ECF subfamily)